MKNKKRNDKGFSLVELIVVIAIMAILAVTLAPRFMKYVDSARHSSDQQTATAIFSAAQIAYLQFPTAFEDADTYDGGADDGRIQLRVSNSPFSSGTPSVRQDATVGLFTSPTSNTQWTINTTTYHTDNKFINELQSTLGSFNLKSSNADADTQITIALVSGSIQVILDYDNDRVNDTADGDLTVTE